MSTATENKQIAKPQPLKAWLQSDDVKSEVAKVLPKILTPERQLRVAMNALVKNPKLADCTPQSFIRCLLELSAWGLEPNGRDAHLIPYGKECTLIIDYKGLVLLAYRSGWVKSIHADVVREGDVFRFSLGNVVEHIPHAFRTDIDRPAQAGNVIAAYAHIVMSDGIVKDEVLTFDEIESIRKRTPTGGNSGPWKTDWCEMAKKTAFRRASKWLPLSSEMVDALERDADTIDATSVRPRKAPSLLEEPEEMANTEQDA